MKKSLSFLCAALALTACGPKQSPSKSLVVYYSQSGATKQVANIFANAVSADIDSIVAENPYNGDFNQTIARCQEEFANGITPSVSTSRNVADYDTIYIGYPVWFGKVAQPMAGWLKSVDLTNKVIIPFCTFGSGGNTSIADIQNAQPNANILNAYGVRNARVSKAEAEIADFLVANGIMPGEKPAAVSYSEPQEITEETMAIFQAACGSYPMPLGTPVSVSVADSNYIFTTESQSPDGNKSQSNIYVKISADEDTVFTHVDR
ncbi:MAG: flavodoxin [Bacteroidia bacterium]|nr:flavodoxin [Bacteroidia bacterium]